MEGGFRTRLAIGAAALLAVLSLAAFAILPAALASRVDDFTGKVVSTDLRLRSVQVDTRSRGNTRFEVNRQTRYEHLNGFSALKPGLKVEVHAKHTSGGWIATKIDRRS